MRNRLTSSHGVWLVHHSKTDIMANCSCAVVMQPSPITSLSTDAKEKKITSFFKDISLPPLLPNTSCH